MSVSVPTVLPPQLAMRETVLLESHVEKVGMDHDHMQALIISKLIAKYRFETRALSSTYPTLTAAMHSDMQFVMQ